MHSRFAVALVTLLLIALPKVLLAELQNSVELSILNSVLIHPDPKQSELGLANVLGGSAKLKFSALGNRNLRADFSLIARTSLQNPQESSIEIDRLYTTARFDDFRLTLGKTRVSWGEGLLFNAADLVMGSTNLNVDLNSALLRDQSLWLASGYLSIDRFSFVEAVMLPPLARIQNNTIVFDGGTAFGARILGEAPDIALKLEGGYFFRENLHSVFFSLYGGEGLSWHLSTRLGMKEGSFSSPEAFFRGITTTAGLSLLQSIGNEEVDLSLSLQAEILVKAEGSFTELEGLQQSENLSGKYGFYGFLGASLGIDRIVQLYIRSIISPIDLSAVISLGGDLGIYQGFSIYALASVQLGDADDTYRNARLGGYSFGIGMRYIF